MHIFKILFASFLALSLYLTGCGTQNKQTVPPHINSPTPSPAPTLNTDNQNNNSSIAAPIDLGENSLSIDSDYPNVLQSYSTAPASAITGRFYFISNLTTTTLRIESTLIEAIRCSTTTILEMKWQKLSASGTILEEKKTEQGASLVARPGNKYILDVKLSNPGGCNPVKVSVQVSKI